MKKKWIEQEVVERAFKSMRDLSELEDFNTFVCRVSNIADDIMKKGKIISISYPTDEIAIISYMREKELN